MVRGEESDDMIRNWMRNKNTIEYLGTWELLHNPNFKGVEFDTFWKEAGLNRFNMTPRKWVERTNAIGLISKAGKGGGTFAHKDIAFHFGMWISPVFQLYVVREYQRLVEKENNPLLEQWNVNRIITKANYTLHTDAVKSFVVPKMSLSEWRQKLVYSSEADMLNLVVFGYTAKNWEKSNPQLAAKGLNMRDTATINQLVVLSNIESLNAELIKRGYLDIKPRMSYLHKVAKEQLAVLDREHVENKFRKLFPQNGKQQLLE